VAVVEFSISLLFLSPLMLGTLVFGFRIVKDIQMQQIVRDLGHMYLRGADFRNPGMVNIAKTLAQGMDLTSSGKSGIAISKIRLITEADCVAAGGGTNCTNINQGAFVEQLKIGNTSVGVSAFGTPPLEADFTVTDYNQARNLAARADGFMAALELKATEIAYVVEMTNKTPDLNIPGFPGRPEVYARAIF
jgi:hypothetical protein